MTEKVARIELPKRSEVLEAKVPLIFVALPAFIFYSILLGLAINLPFLDDYNAILMFVNHVETLGSLSSKVLYFLSAQHNEYKLFFEHALALIQFGICGSVNFGVLCAIGDGFVLLLGLLLWKVFLPNCEDLNRRIALFVPVSWMLFELHYAGTLNWAMAGLQNLPVLVFSFAAIYYVLAHGAGSSYYKSLACLLLAASSSGNGLLVVPLGIFILVRSRRYTHLTGWLIVSATVITAYIYRYNIFSSQSPIHSSVFTTFRDARPLYLLLFLGNAAYFPGFSRAALIVCCVLGASLCVSFTALIVRGYFKKNPTVAYCVSFLFVSAIGVAGMRSDFGISQSLSSRYSIYSVLLVIFAWFGAVEEFPLTKTSAAANRILLSVTMLAVIFSLSSDYQGLGLLVGRNREVRAAMMAFDQSETSISGVGPVLPYTKKTARMKAFDRLAREYLLESMNLGVYRPPRYR